MFPLSPKWQRITATFAVVLLPALTQAQDYRYIAETSASGVAVSGDVRAGGLTWQCKANTCSIEGPWPKPSVGSCNALARQVGHIKYYGYADRNVALNAQQLVQCNQGVAAPGSKRTPESGGGGSTDRTAVPDSASPEILSEIRESATRPGISVPGPANRYIAGRISLVNCAASPSNVQIDITDSAGERQTVAAQHDIQSGSFGFRYRVDNLDADDYVLEPRLVGVDCPGGEWRPDSGAVDLNRTLHADQDFRYRVSEDEARLALSFITSQIRYQFDGTEIHLSNYRPSDQPSFLRLGSRLGGGETYFNIDRYSSGAANFYVNNIDLESIRVFPEGEFIVLRLEFEEDGVEIVGRCRGAECLAGPDSSIPDAHINDFFIDIFLKPGRFYEATRSDVDLSFSEVDVRVGMRLDIRGICDVLDCRRFERYVEEQIKDAVTERVRNMIDTRVVRLSVARAFRPAISGLGIGNIQTIRIEGPDLIIRHIPRT